MGNSDHISVKRIRVFLSNNRYLILILVLSFILRSINLDYPYIDLSAIRQCDTAAIARNFYRNGFNILLPETEVGPYQHNYLETEFGLLPYIAAVLYLVFGVQAYVGRLLSVLFSLGSIVLLYKLVRLMENRKSDKNALITAFIYSIMPISVYFGRTFQPESSMMFFYIGYVLFYFKYIKSNEIVDLLVCIVFGSIGYLVKISAAHIVFLIIFISFLAYRTEKIKLYYGVAVILVPLIVAAPYYWHAYHLGLDTGISFGVWDTGYQKWSNIGLLTSADFYVTMYYRFTSNSFISPLVFSLFIFGLAISFFRQTTGDKTAVAWLMSNGIYIIVVGEGHLDHLYYQLTLTPVMAYLAANATIELLKASRNAKEWTWKETPIQSEHMVLLLILLGTVPGTVGLFTRSHRTEIYSVGVRINENTPDEAALIVLAPSERSGFNKILRYYADRVGVIAWPSSMNISYLKSKVARLMDEHPLVVFAFATDQEILEEIPLYNRPLGVISDTLLSYMADNNCENIREFEYWSIWNVTLLS